ALGAKGRGGRVLDGNRLAEPGVHGLRRGGRPVVVNQKTAQQRVLADVRGNVAFEDDLRSPSSGKRSPLAAAIDAAAALVQLADAAKQVLTAIVVEPNHLERIVAFDAAVGVVVDRFAGTCQQPGGGVVLAEDEVSVRLAALQRDAHGHLVDGAAG